MQRQQRHAMNVTCGGAEVVLSRAALNVLVHREPDSGETVEYLVA